MLQVVKKKALSWILVVKKTSRIMKVNKQAPPRGKERERVQVLDREAKPSAGHLLYTVNNYTDLRAKKLRNVIHSLNLVKKRHPLLVQNICRAILL